MNKKLVNVSEEEIRTSIHFFYDSLVYKNTSEILEVCTENVTLMWGPFVFKGKRMIKRWAKGLGKLFPEMEITHGHIGVQRNRASHSFTLNIVMLDGKKGWLPCIGAYDFKDVKIQQAKITLLYGYLGVKPETTKQTDLRV